MSYGSAPKRAGIRSSHKIDKKYDFKISKKQHFLVVLRKKCYFRLFSKLRNYLESQEGKILDKIHDLAFSEKCPLNGQNLYFFTSFYLNFIKNYQK
jgi:hypothetical protein